MLEDSLCQEMKGEGTPRQKEQHKQMLEGMEMHAGLGGPVHHGHQWARRSRMLSNFLTGEQGCDSPGVSSQAGQGQLG